MRVPQLRTAPATLDFLLAAASSLQAAARRDPRAFSLFLEPAASLVEARRFPALHTVLRGASGADPPSGTTVAHSADGAEGVAEKLWRFSFDAVMPAAARLDAHSSVTIEVDLEQAFGAARATTLRGVPGLNMSGGHHQWCCGFPYAEVPLLRTARHCSPPTPTSPQHAWKTRTCMENPHMPAPHGSPPRLCERCCV